jgi:hypothetical protein
MLERYRISCNHAASNLKKGTSVAGWIRKQYRAWANARELKSEQRRTLAVLRESDYPLAGLSGHGLRVLLTRARDILQKGKLNNRLSQAPKVGLNLYRIH